MFSDNITLNASEGVSGLTNANKVFTLQGTGPEKSTRIDDSSSLSAPITLTISHQTVGKGLQVADRHLVRIDRIVAPTTTIVEDQHVSASLVIHAPRNIVSVTTVEDVIGLLADFLNETGAIGKLLRNET